MLKQRGVNITAKFLVLGAGKMAKAIAYYFVQQGFQVTIASISLTELTTIKRFLKSRLVHTAKLDLNNSKKVITLMKSHDCAVSAVPYHFNYVLAKAAVAAGCHFVDLGGNNDIVRKEFSLHNKAKKKGVAIVPDAGLAPGLVSNLTALGLQEFSSADTIQLRVGGLPQHPKPPLNYMLTFSVEGLINEYVEPVVVIDHYRMKKVKPLNDVEKIHFRGFGQLEAFNTSGGISTLPQSFQGKVRTLNYKTIRYPGHAKQIRLLMELGLASTKKQTINKTKINLRQVLEHVLHKKLTYKGKDVVLLKVIIANKKKRVVFTLIDYETKKLTAMMRCTGFPAAVIAEMLVNGEVKKRGTLKHEFDIPPKKLIKKLREQGLAIRKSVKYT